MPLVHARDAAEAKVAAIGTVNPRPPGFKNNLIQSCQASGMRVRWTGTCGSRWSSIAPAMACVQATLEALTDVSRGLAALSAYHQDLRKDAEDWRSDFEALLQSSAAMARRI